MEWLAAYKPRQGEVLQVGAFDQCQAAPPLNKWVDCFWQLDIPTGNYTYRSLPDNCIDWIFDVNSNPVSFLVSPYDQFQLFEMQGPARFFAIRFRVLGHSCFFREPIGAWDDNMSGDIVSDLTPAAVYAPIMDLMTDSMTFGERCTGVSEILLSHCVMNEPDNRLANFIRYNYEHSGDVSQSICQEIGISPRQLRRLSQLYLGTNPKSFSAVIRFQQELRNLHLGQTPNAAGLYCDQPHFIKSFKRHTGLTPSQYLNMSVLYNS